MATLYLLCGPSLSGKTTLARRLVSAAGAHLVSLDAINAERGLPFGAEGLGHEAWGQTLEVAERRTTSLLQAGHDVVLDDTLCYRWLRDRFRALAARCRACVQLIYLPADPGQLESRRQQLAASGERDVLQATTLAAHLAAFEPPAQDEHAITMRADLSLEPILSGEPRPPDAV